MDFLPKIRSQARASFRSRAARAFRLSRRLFRFSASVDHQMTPALFRPLFRASPSRGLHWRTGCRAPLRGPSVLKHHAAPDCGRGSRASGRTAPCSLERWAEGSTCTADLKHHAASREGCGLGAHVGQRPPSPVRASSRGRLTPFFLAHHAAPDCEEGKAVFGQNCALHLWRVGQRALPPRGASGQGRPPCGKHTESHGAPTKRPSGKHAESHGAPTPRRRRSPLNFPHLTLALQGKMR